VSVGDIMYSISQVIVQMGKDWMQTVLKERTYHVELYVKAVRYNNYFYIRRL